MIVVNNKNPHASFINKLNILTIFAQDFPRSTALYLLSNVIIHSKYFPVSDWYVKPTRIILDLFIDTVAILN